MPGYGALNLTTATATTSFGTSRGVIVQSVVVTHKSNVRALANVRSAASNGTTVIPFDAAGATTSGRYTSSVFLDNQGLPINDKGFVKISGASTKAWVYWRNLV